MVMSRDESAPNASVPAPTVASARWARSSTRPSRSLIASLALHAVAFAGVAWVSLSASGGARRHEPVALGMLEASAPPSHPDELEPPRKLDEPLPLEPALVELPFEVILSDESIFDPQIAADRDPSRTISRLLDVPWTQVSIAEAEGSDHGEPAADVVAPEVASEDSADTPPPVAEPTLVAAELLEHPAPTYPKTSLRRGEEGTVLLRLHIDERGVVTSVDVVRSSDHLRLDDAAVEGVMHWRFEPALRDGEAYATTVLHQITFKFRDSAHS